MHLKPSLSTIGFGIISFYIGVSDGDNLTLLDDRSDLSAIDVSNRDNLTLLDDRPDLSAIDASNSNNLTLLDDRLGLSPIDVCAPAFNFVAVQSS